MNVIATLQTRAPELGDTYRVGATMSQCSGTNILKVPLSARYRNRQDRYVFTVNAKKAHEQKITIDH